MERIQQFALISVRRACGFAALGIATFCVSLSFHPLVALRSGAVLTCLLATVLVYKAQTAMARNHRHTELWMMLGGEPGLPDPQAGRAINSALREVYWQHADIAAGVAFVMAALAVLSNLG